MMVFLRFFFIVFTCALSCVSFVGAEISRRKGLHSSREITSLEVPGSDPITIIEGDSLWEQKKLHPYYDTYTTSSSTNLYNPLSYDDQEKDAKFSHSALKQFLDSYAEKIKNEKFRNATKKNSASSEETEEGKGKKSWDLMNSQKHKHPFEDKKSWVSLDPIPWSVSQISKWRNKPKPTEFSYNTQLENIPWESSLDYSTVSNTPATNSQNYYKYKYPDYQIYPSESSYDKIKNLYKKPAVQRPLIEATLVENFPVEFEAPPQPHKFAANNDNGIITDGLSPNFPKKSLEYNRRQGTEMYQETHPFTGNGNWVLLSTSKGYKYPKKQRAIKLQPQEVNEHKIVQLTVLPPLKDSKVNMTTSHGGLLQVESTFEPVEQSQMKLQKLKKLKNKRKRPVNLKKKKKVEMLRSVSQSLSHQHVPRSTNSDSGAVIAGVGAGLIPATMAMFVPLVMNGKKRRKRDVIQINGNPRKLLMY